jgi:hypothetical protein
MRVTAKINKYKLGQIFFEKTLKLIVMKINYIAMLYLIGFFTGCQQIKATDDPEKLKKLVMGYFKGIENKDFDLLKALTTDDFVLYEDGSIWNNDSAFMNIRRHLPFTVKYTLDNIKIYVDNMSGDMTYSNHADFVFKDSSKESFDWIESATFRKTEQGWKMNFLHLTQRDAHKGK